MRSSISGAAFIFFSFNILLDYDVVFLYAKFHDHSSCESNFVEVILRLTMYQQIFEKTCLKKVITLFLHRILLLNQKIKTNKLL